MNTTDNDKPQAERALEPIEQAQWVHVWLLKNLKSFEARGVDARTLATVLLTTWSQVTLQLQSAEDAATWLESVAAALRAGEFDSVARRPN